MLFKGSQSQYLVQRQQPYLRSREQFKSLVLQHNIEQVAQYHLDEQARRFHPSQPLQHR